MVTQSPYAKVEDFKGKDNLHIWSTRINSFEAYVDSHTNLACLLSNMGENDESYMFCKKAL